MTWGRHSRPLFVKYRSDDSAPTPAPPAFPPQFSPRRFGAKRAPFAFTETAVKRIPAGHPRGLSRQAAAEYIGVGTTLFDAMVRDGRMPRPFRVGARVIWDRRKLDAAFDVLSDQDEDRNPWDEPVAA